MTNRYRSADFETIESHLVELQAVSLAFDFDFRANESTSSRRKKAEIAFGRLLVADLNGQASLVSGGSRGIGAAIARRLASDGARVAITDAAGVDAAKAVVSKIAQAGGKAVAVQADAAGSDLVIVAAEKTIAKLRRLGILVNIAKNAMPERFEETTPEEVARVIWISSRGGFVVTLAAMKLRKGGGRMIAIGSCVGERVLTPGPVAYSTTNRGTKMLTQGLV